MENVQHKNSKRLFGRSLAKTLSNEELAEISGGCGGGGRGNTCTLNNDSD